MEEHENARNIRKKAVALRYIAENDQAPTIVAKGQGIIAEQILELALEHDIHVHEDPDMVEILAKLDLNMEIPESLFKAVAEVLAFVYEMNQSMS